MANGNSCLMIAVLAIVAIFICYWCCDSSFKARMSVIMVNQKLLSGQLQQDY